METQQAIQQIKQQPLASVYLVTGTELYLQEQVRQAFLTRMEQDDLEELNFMRFDLEENNLVEVVAEAETLPFFGDYRLIFVEQPAFLTSKGSASESEIAQLLAYLKAPLASTILVFWANYEKLDARKKVTKALRKAASEIETVPLKENELRRFLQQYLANAGVKLNQDALELFLRLTDFELTKAMNELEKLMLAAGDSGVITKADVEALVPKTLEHNIFELTEQILQGQTEAALKTYEELHLQGEETIKLNAILIGQIRLLLQTKILQKIGYQQANIAETLSIHPYRVKLALQQVKRFSLAFLTTLYDELVENDYQVKVGQLDKELSFQLFILKTTAKLS